ncbi:retrovirus-related pol polyprotein from transposon TNT 1-94 [Tanacetum coccineum]
MSGTLPPIPPPFRTSSGNPAHEGLSDTRDTKITALRLKFNAFKSLEDEKVNGTFTRLKCLLNDLENNGVTIPQAEVNATFVNSLPRKWLSMNQTQRANNSIKNDCLATLYGKYIYEEGLIDQIYESKIQRFSIQASSLKALISNSNFQDSDSDVEEDQRTNNEFVVDLNTEYHERALLANQKRFYKRSKSVGSARKPIDKTKETCFACGKMGHFQKDWPSNKTSTPPYPSSNNSFNKPKAYTPPFNQTSSQNSCNHQKDYKGKYKGLKAEMDDESVSSDDEGSTKIKAFMEIAEDEPSVGKVDARSGQWVDITMKMDYLKKSVWGPFTTKTMKLSSLLPEEKMSMSLISYLSIKKSMLVSLPRPPQTSTQGTPGYCLKKKSDAADCIMSFIRKMENLNEVRVKELRSDNGTEFKNHKLEEFCDEKGISQNFSSPYTPEQNGVSKRRNKTLIEAARTMLNSAKLPKQFWGEAVNTVYYTQNRSIIVKRHGKTSYDVFKGRSPDISYFHMFGCHIYIHNHKDHFGKFDKKDDDGLFLGYSSVAKAFRVFNIKRQEMEKIVHVIFSEDDEAISQSSTEGDAINFNENRSFLDDEFLEPRSKVTQCPNNTKYFPYIPTYKNTTPFESPFLQVFVTSEDPPEFTEAHNYATLNKPDQTESADHFEPVVPQNNVIIKRINRWLREKHIELVNIIGEPLTGITTRSRIRDSDDASAFECLYVNFLSKMEPKKLIEALKEEGWIIAMQEELNQFKRNKVWTLVPNLMGYNQLEKIDYEETFVPVARLEAIRIFLAYATYMGFMVYHMNLKSAFLNGKILEEVYVQQPPGFESSEFPNHVCKLDKALYGLKQAPRAWYETLSKFLIQHKFVRGTDIAKITEKRSKLDKHEHGNG